jgi:hypothetical protein
VALIPVSSKQLLTVWGWAKLECCYDSLNSRDRLGRQNPYHFPFAFNPIWKVKASRLFYTMVTATQLDPRQIWQSFLLGSLSHIGNSITAKDLTVLQVGCVIVPAEMKSC